LLLLAAATVAVAGPDVSADLRSKDPERRLSALVRMAEEGGDVSRGIARRLAHMLAKESRADLRGAAARALAVGAGEDAIEPLLDAVERERDDRAAAALATAFAHVPGDAARKPLARVAFDDGERRAGALAAEALGRLPDGVGVDDLLSLLRTAPHWAVAAGACLGLGVCGTPTPPCVLPRGTV
jgi:HEAT repeat protein